jgi:eukaryotic-like serine/threonine-protein kinase
MKDSDPDDKTRTSLQLAKDSIVGHYRIIEKIGAGGMGEVYLAEDIDLNRRVALKFLPLHLSKDADCRARFKREAQAAAKLNHPNIVTIHEVSEFNGRPFFAMENVEGKTARDLGKDKELRLSGIIELAIQICEGLAKAHSAGIVHRDIKPSNILIDRDGRVKIVDFGLASIHGGERLTKIGATMGTVGYMSPEQVQGEEIDARSDLFSFGIVLYELVAGRTPFKRDNDAATLRAILSENSEPLARYKADVPHDLQRIITKSLAKNPAERYQSALDLSADLRMILRQQPSSPDESTDYSPGKQPSIAVLPFTNMSADPADEYFSDGLADELINMLAKIKGLRVAARFSSFQFKGKNGDLAEIGAKLKVNSVLDGSVRKSGNRVRISVQLVKVTDGYHLWSEIYDRTLDDVFAVQDDITKSVVMELRTTLMGVEADSGARGRAKADVARAAKGRSNDAEAHRLYLLAKFLNDRMTRDDTAKGLEYLREATARDPKFALAWVERGRAYLLEANNGWIPSELGYERAREAIKLALELEPDLAEAHAAMGWIQMFHDWNWRGAEESFNRALELAPGNERVLLNAGALASNQGRVDEALRIFHRAMEQDPLSTRCFDNLGIAFYAADRFEEAEEMFRTSLSLAPQRAWTRAIFSLCLLAQGRSEEALAQAMQEPEEAWRLWALAIIHNAMGNRLELGEAIRELIEKYADSAAVQIAEVQAISGDPDAAFEWLEKAYSIRDGGLAEMKSSRHFRSLHGDPRWVALLKKVGFES